MRRSALPFTVAGSRSAFDHWLEHLRLQERRERVAPPPRRRPICATTLSGVISGITKVPSEMARARPSAFDIGRDARIVVVRPVMTPLTRPWVSGGASLVTASAASDTEKAMCTALSGIGSPLVAEASSAADMSTVMSTESARPPRNSSTR